MGTRNLTCVFIDGEYKVAQYGQWDGYPEGQGTEILNFLHDKEAVERLKKNLSRVVFMDIDNNEEHARKLQELQANMAKFMGEQDSCTEDQRRWVDLYISRDVCAEILINIANDDKEGPIYLFNRIDFAGDSLFCEWAYVVDFDKGKLEVYEGFNRKVLDKDERFASLPIDEEQDNDPKYQQVRFVTAFDLDDLPNKEIFCNTIHLIESVHESEN